MDSDSDSFIFTNARDINIKLQAFAPITESNGRQLYVHILALGMTLSLSHDVFINSDFGDDNDNDIDSVKFRE